MLAGLLRPTSGTVRVCGHSIADDARRVARGCLATYPTVGLDPRSVRMVKDILKKQAAAGTTVFISTHTLSIAEEIADRIGIVDRGRLNFFGTREEVATEMQSRGLTLERFFLDITERRGPRRPHILESGHSAVANEVEDRV